MSRWGGRKAVLSVHVPGRAPYAVFEPHYKRPRGKAADHLGAGLPALVSITDPNDVEILWDEVPSMEDQVAQRISDAFQGQQARLEQAQEMQAKWTEAAQGPGAAPAAGVPPGAGTPSAEAMEMLNQNAKRTLAYVTDPSMRRMLIAQYRASGIEIEEEDEAP